MQAGSHSDSLAASHLHGIIRAMIDLPDSPLHHRIVALAALAHVSLMVNEVARTGSCDMVIFKRMVDMLFADQDRIIALQYHRATLDILKGELRGSDREQAKVVMHYMMGMMTLEKTLSRETEMLKKIGDGIIRVEKQIEFFGDTAHDNSIAAISGLYGDTLSTLKPRIMVHGKPEFLNHACNTNRVRSLLFAGIRAAHCWRSNGGNNFRLVIERNKMLRTLQLMLQEE
ncbi:MAG: DUF489 family protein [Mariprofundaceae bacterium]|nr:DUF489 family protein [Mariprofundaceae bacterium]